MNNKYCKKEVVFQFSLLIVYLTLNLTKSREYSLQIWNHNHMLEQQLQYLPMKNNSNCFFENPAQFQVSLWKLPRLLIQQNISESSSALTFTICDIENRPLKTVILTANTHEHNSIWHTFFLAIIYRKYSNIVISAYFFFLYYIEKRLKSRK